MKIFLHPPEILNEKKRKNLERWLEVVCKAHGKTLKQLFIFNVPLKDIQQLHQCYFNKREATDIITLDYSNDKEVTATLYCCSEFIRSHLQAYEVATLEEALLRVILHGVLHTLGYNDHTLQEQKKMTETEMIWLKKFFVSH